MNDYYCINELFQERRHSVFKLVSLPLKIHYMERPFTEDQLQSILFKDTMQYFKLADHHGKQLVESMADGRFL